MSHIDIVFSGPPSRQAPEFIEVENEERKSISFGEWMQRDDGYWVLRIPRDENSATLTTRLKTVGDALKGLFSLHEPEGRFQPSHYKPFLRKAADAIKLLEGEPTK